MRFAFMTLILLILTPVLASGQEMETEAGYVLQVEDMEGRLVYIDKGQDEVEPDQMLQIVRQENIIHPVTGYNLGGQIPLGVVRIVQVFSRLSTAEVVKLVRGMDMEALDREAKQGMIRTHPLGVELETEMREEIVAKETGRIAPPGKINPDGIVGKVTPQLQIGLGSTPEIRVPDRISQLIRNTTTVGDLGSKPVGFLPEGAYASSANTVLLALADTTVGAALESFGSSSEVFLTLDFPRNPSFSITADVGMGSRSQIAVGARLYPGKRLGFLGDGYTPEGHVGEPVITLKLGWGGQGPRSLPVSVQARLAARSDLQADSVFISTLDSVQVLSADSLFQAGATQMLRAAATDSLHKISKRGAGFIFGLRLPITRHFAVRGGMTNLGNLKEISAGITYYMKTVELGAERTNPDGALRSFILSLDWTNNSELSQQFFRVDVTYPVSMRYTLAAGFLSDFSRYGGSLKGYF